jgi:hypothetical protein
LHEDGLLDIEDGSIGKKSAVVAFAPAFEQLGADHRRPLSPGYVAIFIGVEARIFLAADSWAREPFP